ncbi:TRAP transporter substrate-binding protein [Nitratireductor sp. B36]|jgi:TRAP-type C4-dicarboxylate transport system substrate-binding protein|uniref:TRAP transporter substrate-binding protein n=1 Tax=Nitratireductor sp. B36 TaxID=2762059 RepID=UPI001E5DBF5F|nr:TRAP transporter substrate-binding protein [Nitratireductor sp. B36]MCC5780220.1 TRAP transporter substrate-binding protein [Nitratireductor sp. B36]
MTRMLKTFVTASILTTVMSFGAMAQETVLRMSNWLPPSHPIVRDMMIPWAEKLKEASDGRIEVQILDAPLGPPPAHFDLAANGAVDLTFGVHGYTPGRFTLTEIAEMPFLADTSESLSVAFWRVFESDLAQAEEHRGTKVLGVFGHGPGLLFTKGKPVSPLSDLSGAKIRVAGNITNKLAEAMDMVSIQAPSPQSYEILSGGIADGIFFPVESVPFFKLETLVDKALRVPGGLYNVSFFFVMNKAKFDSLSDEDKAAIEEVSGEAFSRMAGQAWDAADAAGMEVIGSTVDFHDATEEELATLREKTQPMFDDLAKAYEAKGLDFDVVMGKLKDEIKAVAAE